MLKNSFFFVVQREAWEDDLELLFLFQLLLQTPYKSMIYDMGFSCTITS